MTLRKTLICAAAAALLGTQAAAAPDEFQLKLPGKTFFDGGLLSVTFIGPDAGEVITDTIFDIGWHNTGESNPRDLSIEIGVPVDEGTAWFTVTGAELGFSADGGMQRGTISTQALNGEVWPNFIAGTTIVDAYIWDEQVGNTTGSFVNATITFVFGAADCSADFNGDGVTDVFDILDFVQAYIDGDASADANGDGVVDFWDVHTMIQSYLGHC